MYGGAGWRNLARHSKIERSGCGLRGRPETGARQDATGNGIRQPDLKGRFLRHREGCSNQRATRLWDDALDAGGMTLDTEGFFYVGTSGLSPSPRTCPVSFTWQATRAGSNPRFLRRVIKKGRCRNGSALGLWEWKEISRRGASAWGARPDRSWAWCRLRSHPPDRWC